MRDGRLYSFQKLGCTHKNPSRCIHARILFGNVARNERVLWLPVWVSRTSGAGIKGTLLSRYTGLRKVGDPVIVAFLSIR